MATISGTTLTYGSGASQTAGGGKVIRYGYGEYNTRTSLPNANNYIFWDACTINRQRSDSDFHVVALMPGHDWHSFPYGGTFVEIKDVSGNKYRSYKGSQYLCCGEGGSQEIVMKVDWTFRDSAIASTTGNWTVHFGYQSYNGGNNKWCNIWNPNASDDGRGYQKSSTCFVEEIIYGD
tara:strand:+ start:1805 stop:2338 length:534 start_codon:yes stop_codon:yes gene_type:complete